MPKTDIAFPKAGILFFTVIAAVKSAEWDMVSNLIYFSLPSYKET